MTTAQTDPTQGREAPTHNPVEGTGTLSHYRRDGSARIIDISASSVPQLFSGLDPAPFRHRDLDPEVESYIVAALREIGGPQRAKLVFHLPDVEISSPAGQGLADAIHNYFAYRAWVMDQDLRRLARIGAASFAIGMAFLFFCLLLRRVLTVNDGAAGDILSEGLLIMGWVAMWRPLQLALYDWWPVWRQRRLYRRLTRVRVETQSTMK